jgi:hypothetical protein
LLVVEVALGIAAVAAAQVVTEQAHHLVLHLGLHTPLPLVGQGPGVLM